MSTPTLSSPIVQVRRTAPGNLRLRLKPSRQGSESVQGAWWPRTDQLFIELQQLLPALAPHVGSVDRVVYDETTWTPQPLRMEFRGRSLILEGSSTAESNTLSLVAGSAKRLTLLVVPPHTNPAHAYTAMMMASDPDDVATPDELLGIGPEQARDRRLALLAQQRWESEGGALKVRHAH